MIDIKPIEGFNNYCIGKNGIVYRRYTRGDKIGYKPLKQSYTPTGRAKVGLCGTSRDIALLVYRAFKNTIIDYNDIVFLDNNKKNCSLENLITISELVEFYKNNK